MNAHTSYARLARAAAAGFFAVLAGAALAALDSASPGRGSVGTVFTLDGSGFGMSKPRLSLTNAMSPKRIPMKVLAFSDTQITAAVPGSKRSLNAGVYDVVLEPRGADEPFILEGAIRLDPPFPDTVTPTTLAPKATVVIDGTNFGTKKGRVTVGGKPAKVTAWTDTSITAVLHKKTPAGAQTLFVENALGEAAPDTQVTVTDPSDGGHADLVSGTIIGSVGGAAGFRGNLRGETSGTGFTAEADIRRGATRYTVRLDASNLNLSTVDIGGTIFVPVSLEFDSSNGGTTWKLPVGPTVVVAKRGAYFEGTFPASMLNRTVGTDGDATLAIDDFEIRFRAR